MRRSPGKGWLSKLKTPRFHMTQPAIIPALLKLCCLLLSLPRGGMREGLISPNLLQLPGVEQTLARPPGGHTRGLLSISSHGDPLSPLPAPQKNSSWMMWAGVGDVEVLRHLVTAPGVGRSTQPAPPVPRQPGKPHRQKVKNKGTNCQSWF